MQHALWIVLPLLFATRAPLSRPSAQQAAVETSLEGLEKRFRLEIVRTGEPFPVQTLHGAISGTDATSAELEAYAPLLAFELGLYPKDLMRRTRLERIVLCKRLAFGDQLRSAVPDFEHGTLYLDAARGRHSDLYQRQVIHHELFHVIDWRDDGQLYEDAAWAALNPPGFRYGSGGSNAQDDSSMSLMTDAQPGFLTRYATSGVEEDKAETCALMILRPQAVEDRAKTDEVLRRKTERMVALLERFSDEADRRFWRRVQAAAREREQAAAKER